MIMQKATFVVINPRFAFSDEDIPSNTSNISFQSLRDISNTSISFPRFLCLNVVVERERGDYGESENILY